PGQHRAGRPVGRAHVAAGRAPGRTAGVSSGGGAGGAAGASSGGAAGGGGPPRDRPRRAGAVAGRRLRSPLAVAVLVGLVAAAWAALALPARATVGARLTADEPQYLLSALSLARDRDLFIDDELAAEDY